MSSRSALGTNLKLKRNKEDHRFYLSLVSNIRRTKNCLSTETALLFPSVIIMNQHIFVVHFLNFVICSFVDVRCFNLKNTARIGVVTDKDPLSHTEMFSKLQNMTEEINKNTSVSNWPKLELVPVNLSKNASVNTVVDVLCNTFLPQNVLGILSLVEGEKSHLLTKLAGVFDMPLLGTARSISMMIKVSERFNVCLGNWVFCASICFWSMQSVTRRFYQLTI